MWFSRTMFYTALNFVYIITAHVIYIFKYVVIKEAEDLLLTLIGYHFLLTIVFQEQCLMVHQTFCTFRNWMYIIWNGLRRKQDFLCTLSTLFEILICKVQYALLSCLKTSGHKFTYIYAIKQLCFSRLTKPL